MEFPLQWDPAWSLGAVFPRVSPASSRPASVHGARPRLTFQGSPPPVTLHEDVSASLCSPPGPPFSVAAWAADQGCQGRVITERGGPGSWEGARALEEGRGCLVRLSSEVLGKRDGVRRALRCRGHLSAEVCCTPPGTAAGPQPSALGSGAGPIPPHSLCFSCAQARGCPPAGRVLVRATEEGHALAELAAW